MEGVQCLRITIEEGGEGVKLQEIDTIQDLREWVEENMPGARLTEDSAGNIVIHTNLTSSMGGYLHEIEGEDDNA